MVDSTSVVVTAGTVGGSSFLQEIRSSKDKRSKPCENSFIFMARVF